MSDPDAERDARVRVIAFYLPQYHTIPENDAWWGEGFTEWTNVRKARPKFSGHGQPQVPGELGYYSLLDPDVREAQAALARRFGVDAFCYYWYWFGGRRLLERPLDAVLHSGRPDFPFCVCWANENWTRRWDGRDEDVLMAQRYSDADSDALIDALIPAFRDPRYVRIGGRPLFVVYKIADIPDVAVHVARWRARCVAAGVGDPYLAAVQRNAGDDPTPYGFDASVEFPPIGHCAENRATMVTSGDPAFRGSVFSYPSLVADYLVRPRPTFRTFRGVTPMWDNTPRRQDDGMAFVESSPEIFGFWTEHVVRQTRQRHRGDERLVFVNAWNEWAEGNHLEPDTRYGTQYLEALRDALAAGAEPVHVRPTWVALLGEATSALAAARVERFGARRAIPKVSVVMPVFNHEAFLPRTLASIAIQDVPLELIAIDDGSVDDSAEIIAGFAHRAPFPVTLVRQANAGAHLALNRGLSLAQAPVISIANSDDLYAPGRLAAMLAHTGGIRPVLAFSDTEFIDDADHPIDEVDGYVGTLRAAIDRAAAGQLLETLTQFNVAVSTGNLVFDRTLAERIGGFAKLKVCHDWDFVMAASYAAQLVFVPQRLYRYRLHGGNTFAGGRLAGTIEGDIVLARFFARISEHPALADAEAHAAFLALARSNGLGGFLQGVHRRADDAGAWPGSVPS